MRAYFTLSCLPTSCDRLRLLPKGRFQVVLTNTDIYLMFASGCYKHGLEAFATTDAL